MAKKWLMVVSEMFDEGPTEEFIENCERHLEATFVKHVRDYRKFVENAALLTKEYEGIVTDDMTLVVELAQLNAYAGWKWVFPYDDEFGEWASGTFLDVAER